MSQDQTPSSQQSHSAAWYYFTADNQRIGPITAAQLKQLAAMGHITPDTIIENVNGRREKAGNVRGLTFSTAKPVPADTPRPEITPIPLAVPVPTSSTPTATTSSALPIPRTNKASRPAPETQAFAFRLIALVLTVLVVGVGFGFGWRYFSPSSKEVATASSSVSSTIAQQPQAQPQSIAVPPVTPPSVTPPSSISQPIQPVASVTRRTTISVDTFEWGLPSHGANFSLWINGEKIDSIDKSKDDAIFHHFDNIELPVGETTVEGRVGFKNGYGQIMEEKRIKAIILATDTNLPATLSLSVPKYSDTSTLRGVEAVKTAAEARKKAAEERAKWLDEQKKADEARRVEDEKQRAERKEEAEKRWAEKQARSPIIRIKIPWTQDELDKNYVYKVAYTLLVNGKEYEKAPMGLYTGDFHEIFLSEDITNLEGRVELKTVDGKVVTARSVTTTIDATKEIPKTIELEVSKTAPTKAKPTHTVTVQ